ncbi:hypothetical protein FOJ82_01895 [Tessaracoccus rhinocerotis]|uniref:Galactosyltransferase C-terminal domain-containing protein n=1 Tax=Tessaracoccus rhinocerotis TaxID=1689449 RepID=A0A553K4N5_9ACTN|nr:galactosyltransferase-related protein [Tessaracoccus rhinocerotis]TRY19663.1 hypothetical protein FOJ82_01895 [Tessaracoccus rhinocerotis]
MSGELAVVTVVSGRHRHLQRQRRGLVAGGVPPAVHVVVSMGDPSVSDVMSLEPGLPSDLVQLPASGKLPLAAARNAGVARAAALGVRAVALLDVDCIPEPGLVADYDRLLGMAPGPGPAVVSGRVRYLPEAMGEDDYEPSRLEALGRDHPARVLPTSPLAPGDPRLLWSLNLGVTTRDWAAIGGFDEDYVGYGGEDTDFGQRLAAAGGRLWWSAAAGVFHQWHPVSRPPVEHVADIVANANRFHSRWGWYPMEGWLEAFRDRGLVTLDDSGWSLVTER